MTRRLQQRPRVSARVHSSLVLCLSFLLIAPTQFLAGQTSHAELARWSFESAGEGIVVEKINGVRSRIEGTFLPTSGPTGPAILMDGYTTLIRSAPLKALTNAQDFSLTCWIKIDAYPWNDLPILDQEANGSSTYLGVDAEGHLLARVGRDHGLRKLITDEVIPLRKWSLVTLTLDREGKARLFIDSAVATTRDWVEAGDVERVTRESAANDLVIGQVRSPRLPGPAKMIHPQLPVTYSLQGSLGEIVAYAGALTSPEIEKLVGAADTRMLTPTPAPPFPRSGPGTFGAFYTTLKFDPGWDMTRRMERDPDVVVRFAQAPIELVFWQGNNFVPAWVTENNRWYTDEFMEVYGHPRCPDGEDCEPMSDKQSRYSHVRILESTPARAVVQWRYALSEVENYKIADSPSATNWGDWGDENWTVYPDGVAIRKQVLWSAAAERDKTEFQESIVLIPAGERPEDSIEYDALTFANLKGDTHTYRWQPKTAPGFSLPVGPAHFPEPADAVIQWVNLKSTWKPFEVAWGSPVTFDAYNGEKSMSAFEWWNHWPVAQVPSSGRPALAADRPGHTSVSHIYWPVYEQDAQHLARILMTGLTRLPATDLPETAASWRTPAAADVDSGQPVRYDPSQRAYLFTVAAPKKLKITLHGSVKTPVVHPAFVISGWKGSAMLSVAGTVTGSVEPSIGQVDGLQHSNLIVFLPIITQSDVTVTISPEPAAP